MMLHYDFTVRELLCMALLNGFEEIWGVPNVLEDLTEEEMEQFMRQTVDSLLGKQVFHMDMDGNMSMDEDYAPLVSICCDCDRCMVVSGQKPGMDAYELVVWVCRGMYLAAEVNADVYTFHAVDESALRSFVCWNGTGTAGDSSAAVPKSALRKAERHFREGQMDDGLRILHQNGAPEEIAAVLADGMLGKAESLNLTVNRRKGTERERFSGSYLGGRGMTLELARQVIGFKTCLKLTAVDAETVKQKLTDVLRDFFGN